MAREFHFISSTEQVCTLREYMRVHVASKRLFYMQLTLFGGLWLVLQKSYNYIGEGEGVDAGNCTT